MRRKAAILLFLILFVVALFVTSTAFAQNGNSQLTVPIQFENDNTSNPKVMPANGSAKATNDTTTSNNDADTDDLFECESYYLSLKTKIDTLLLTEISHSEKYQFLYNRILAIAEKSTILGYDTTTLYDDLERLDLLITTFQKGYNNLVKELLLFSTVDCDSIDENDLTAVYDSGVFQNPFAPYLKDAKANLAVVRKNAQEIADFYEDVLREDILNLELKEKN